MLAIVGLAHLDQGVNVGRGRVTHPAVAEGVGMPFTPVEEILDETPQEA